MLPRPLLCSVPSGRYSRQFQMSNSKFPVILDAAERVVLRDGPARLTLEAVAAEAALSKGGVLYHFASKEDLIHGMVARVIDQLEEKMARFRAADPQPAGRNTRAFLDALLRRDPAAPAHMDRICASLLAAVATNPGLLAPLRDRFRAWQDAFQNDGLDPITALILCLAADGLWFNGLLQFPPFEPELRDRIIARLRLHTEPQAQARAAGDDLPNH